MYELIDFVAIAYGDAAVVCLVRICPIGEEIRRLLGDSARVALRCGGALHLAPRRLSHRCQLRPRHSAERSGL